MERVDLPELFLSESPADFSPRSISFSFVSIARICVSALKHTNTRRTDVVGRTKERQQENLQQWDHVILCLSVVGWMEVSSGGKGVGVSYRAVLGQSSEGAGVAGVASAVQWWGGVGFNSAAKNQDVLCRTVKG